MENDKLKRNTPADENNNDHNLRDHSGQQPGTNTMSKSGTDDLNQEVTKTAGSGFRTGDKKDENADKAFDDVDEK